MSKSKFCCTCTYWEKVAPMSGSMSGLCHDTSVHMKVGLEGFSCLNQGGQFWTAANFGCIQWRENDGSLLSTDKHVKQEVQDNIDRTQKACPVCNKPNNPGNEFCVWCKIQF